MDFQTKALLVALMVPLMGLVTLVVVLGYCRWLHKRGITDPEARVAILLQARRWVPLAKRGSDG